MMGMGREMHKTPQMAQAVNYRKRILLKMVCQKRSVRCFVIVILEVIVENSFFVCRQVFKVNEYLSQLPIRIIVLREIDESLNFH